MHFQELFTNELCHLYHESPGFPYRVYKRADKVMRHFPPKKEECSEGCFKDWDANNAAIGIRGITVEHLFKKANEQKVWLHWCGIDIDWPNPQFQTPEDLRKKVYHLLMPANAYHALYGSVRCSKSGNGLHVFFKLDRAYEFYGSEAASAAAHTFIMPWVGMFNRAGIETCMRGLPNMWVWGGKQKWWERSTAVHCLPETVSQSRKPSLTRNAAAPSEGFAGSIVTALLAAGIELPTEHTQINVGAVKRALQDLLPIKTQSKCRTECENESNGFISFDEHYISLFSSPDNVGGIGSGWLFRIPRED